MPQFTVFPMVPTEPLAWGLVPEVCGRIASFVEKYDENTDGTELARLWRWCFAQSHPGAHVILAMIDGKVVGHILLTLDEWIGSKWVSVMQFQTDVVLDRAQLRAAFAKVEEAARTLGATEIRCAAYDEHRARCFARFYGLKPYRILMRKEL